MPAKSSKMPAHGNRKYPWESWENGEVHTLKRGENFFCSAARFRQMVLNRAKSSGLSATTRVNGNTVIFEFQKPRPKTARRKATGKK